METLQPRARIAPRDEAPIASNEPPCGRNIAVVYQDPFTLDWAMRECQRVTRLSGDLSARSSWWKVRYLRSPELLCDAVQAARTADVIMVSVRAFEVPPPVLQEWTEAWLACRPQHAGALIALIGVPQPARRQSSYTQEYWRAAAGRGRLDYVAHERPLPVERPRLHAEKVWDRSTTLQVAQETVAF